MASMGWTLQDAVTVCTKIENICPLFNCHVALTGGVLYKEGERKDLDVLFYRVRKTKILLVPLLQELYHKMGLRTLKNDYWCQKMQFAENWPFAGRSVDAFFPELFGDDYPSKEGQ